jgi:hypothetical protein
MRLRDRVKFWLDAKARARLACSERVDPALLKRKPSRRMLLGLFVIGLSYITCWPLISVLGIAAIRFHNPLLFSVGSPTAYISSHLLFLAGAALVGVEGLQYARLFLLWCTRHICEKLLVE